MTYPAFLKRPVYLFLIAYWLIWLFIMSSFQPIAQTIRVATVNVGIQILVALVNVRYLIPVLLEKKHYIRYGILLVLLIAALTVLHLQLIEPDVRTLPARREIRYPAAFQFTRVFLMLSIVSIAGIAYKFACDRFLALQRQTETSLKQVESELQMLRNQINPHFLFNTLNNIYTLTYLKEDNAAPMLMKLSELLRYMLYECRESLVTLGKEVVFLKNLVAMQQLKSAAWAENLQLSIQIDDPSARISPLVLLIFIENCFKHADLDTNAAGFVRINVHSDANGLLHFHAANSARQSPAASSEPVGIGLDNVRRRLELVYPDRHKLDIREANAIFEVNLTLPLL